jgi:hypothetical protein
VEKYLEPDRPQMTEWCMHIACWIPEGTNTHSVYVTLFALPLQQWLHERASFLFYTYIVCFVCFISLYLSGLWKVTGQEDRNVEIRKRKFRWIGHTLRKEGGEIPKSVLFWNPQGNRKRGRSRNS